MWCKHTPERCGSLGAGLLLLVLVAVVLLAPVRAASAQMLQALRAGDWQAAKSLAAADPDPVAATLVEFLHILNDADGPDRPGAAEISAFIKLHPDWPEPAALARRLADAIQNDADLGAVASACAAHPVTAPPALVRCAEAQASRGQDAAAQAAARAAWIGGLAGQAAEAAFLERWAQAIRPEDQWARFGKVVGDDGAAARQLDRLDGPHRLTGSARLALRHDDPSALAALEKVPADLRSQPDMVLEEARYLRRGESYPAAVALWKDAGFAAEKSVAQPARGPFWTERDMLARKLLVQGDKQGALLIADDNMLAPDQAGDTLFLAGWILLRQLNDPAAASERFAALAKTSHSAITSSRAHYWLGRAAAAKSGAPAAQNEYRLAADWPTTFYGQAALSALGQDPSPSIVSLRDPVWQQSQAQALTSQELGRAALKLVAWGDARRARSFVLKIGQMAQTPQDFALSAGLALRLGLADTAVQIARLAGRVGVVLPQTGWPVPVTVPAKVTDPALVLGLMRQESSFDPTATSPAGARGLMQLMPRTAQQVSVTLGGPHGVPNLFDADENIKLGTQYLASLLEKFGGVPPYAIAAYNAGPHRVRDWLAANGDPAAADPGHRDADGMIDWIEEIPFSETRNYVQRVMENTEIYRTRLSASR